MKIIGVTGQARAGKDTVGNYLLLHHKFNKLSFAEPIKRMVCAMLNCERDWLEENKETHIEGLQSPRVLMQTLGTEWGRNIIDTNVWVNIVNREVNSLIALKPHYNCEGVVITDCRFKNEAEWIRGNGGEVWKVHRDNIPSVASHSSEYGIHEGLIDHHLDNNGSKEELFLQIRRLL